MQITVRRLRKLATDFLSSDVANDAAFDIFRAVTDFTRGYEFVNPRSDELAVEGLAVTLRLYAFGGLFAFGDDYLMSDQVRCVARRCCFSILISFVRFCRRAGCGCRSWLA